jgi:hypothetical protein
MRPFFESKSSYAEVSLFFMKNVFSDMTALIAEVRRLRALVSQFEGLLNAHSKR